MSPAPPKVLVVDDDSQILRALRIHFAARKFDVMTATTGAGALAAVEELRPDVLVLDLGLPDLDGVEVLKRLRAWTDVPVIVLSGRTDRVDRSVALDAGADVYVTKPFSVDELLAQVRLAISTREEAGRPARWT